MDAREQPDEIVLATEREHRVDQVVPDASLTLLDLQAVGEEFEKFGANLHPQTILHQQPDHPESGPAKCEWVF